MRYFIRANQTETAKAMRVPGRPRHRHVLALLFGAFACIATSARAVDVTPPSSPSTNHLKVDNPVFSSEAYLSTYQEAQRTADNRWVFSNFIIRNLVGECQDIRCIQGGSLPNRSAWPAEVGTWGPDGDYMPWEVHGLSFGPEDLSVNFQTQSYTDSFGTEWFDDAISLKLDPYVTLVPVQVVVVVPKYEGEAYDVMSAVDEESQWALWEDRWGGPAISGSSPPSGCCPQVQGQWTTLTAPTRASQGLYRRVVAPGSVIDYVRPDDVFAQCGVQFRMVDYVQVVQDERHVEFLDAGLGICEDSQRQALLAEILQQARAQPHVDVYGNSLLGIRSQIPTVVFNYRSYNTTGHPEDCPAPADTLGVVGDNAILVGVGDNVGAPNSDLTLSHLLGHLFQLDHPDRGADGSLDPNYCGGGQGSPGDTQNLMCYDGNSIGPHIFSCGDWWFWTGNVGEAHNCIPDPTETPAGGDCTTVRKYGKPSTSSVGSGVLGGWWPWHACWRGGTHGEVTIEEAMVSDPSTPLDRERSEGSAGCAGAVRTSPESLCCGARN